MICRYWFKFFLIILLIVFPEIVFAQKAADTTGRGHKILGEKQELGNEYREHSINVERGLTVFIPGNAPWLPTNLLDAFVAVPGIKVDVQNQSVTFQDKSVVVEMDGRMLRLSDEALFAYLEGLPVYNIIRVEFDSNPGVKYSAGNSNIALIRIATKGNTENSISGNVNAGFLRSVKPAFTPLWGVNLIANAGKFDFSVNTRGRGINSYSSGYTNNEYFDDNGHISSILNTDLSQGVESGNFASRSASIGYRSGKSNIGVFYTHNNLTNLEHVSNQRSYLYSPDGELIDFIDMQTESKILFNSSVLSTQYSYALNDNGSSLKMVWDIAKRERGLTSEIFYKESTNDLAPSFQFMDTKSNDNAVRLDWTNGKKTEYPIEAGFNYTIANAENTNLMEGFSDGVYDFNDQRGAAYVSIQHNRGKWFTRAGMRTEFWYLRGTFQDKIIDQTDHISSKQAAYLPNFLLEYKINEGHQVTFTQNSWARRPNYRALNPQPMYRDEFNILVGNPNLKSVYGYGYALQYSKDKGPVVKIQFNNEKNTVSSIIASNEGDVAITNYFNMDYNNTLGLSITKIYEIKKWWSLNLWAELSYVNNAGVFEGRDLSLRVNNLFSTTVKQQFKLPYSTMLSVSAYYKNKTVSGLNINYQPVGNIDIAVRKEFLNRKLIAEFMFDNLVAKGAVRQAFYSDAYYSSERYYEGTWAQRITFRATYNFGQQGKNTYRRTGQNSSEQPVVDL